MGNELETVHEEVIEECIHYWLIDGKNFGVCKKCGEAKQFCSSWNATSVQKGWSNRSGKAQANAPEAKG
jgi:hypothetical protein